MTAKHTPGPWIVSRNHEDLPIVVSESHGAVPIRTPFRDDAFSSGPQHSDHDDAEIAANARLIAAAPEMLGALYTVLNLGACCRLGSEAPAMKGLDVDYHWNVVRAAIRAAEGRE